MLRIIMIIMLMAAVFNYRYTAADEPKTYTSVDAQNYQSEVINSNGPLIVFFYAKWCPYSGSLLPIYNDIEKEYNKSIKFCRFLLGKEYMDFATPEGKGRWQLLKEKYGVEVIPTLIMYNQGQELDRMSGRPEKEIVNTYHKLLKEWVESNLIKPEIPPYRFKGTLLLQKNEK